jgi:hypothetical protein
VTAPLRPLTGEKPGAVTRLRDVRLISGMPPRRFPPPWTVDEADPKLDRRCFIVRDANGQALAYVYVEGERGRRAAAHRLTRDEARRDRYFGAQ